MKAKMVAKKSSQCVRWSALRWKAVRMVKLATKNVIAFMNEICGNSLTMGAKKTAQALNVRMSGTAGLLKKPSRR